MSKLLEPLLTILAALITVASKARARRRYGEDHRGQSEKVLALRSELDDIALVRPVTESLGLLFDPEFVLHRLYAGDLPCRPRRVGTGHDV